MTTKTFLKYRNVWMGIAMVWVIWYHTSVSAGFMPLEHLRSIGYGGVDIFLFASGAGCYLSLAKDPDPYRFLKRRIARLFPTYWCFLPVWLLFQFVTDNMTVQAALGNILGVQALTGLGKDFNWYISGILLLYLLAPLFRSMMDHSHRIAGDAAALALLTAMSIPFWNAPHLIIIATRVCVYYLGMLFGRQCLRSEQISRRTIVLAAVCSLAGMAWLLLNFKLLGHYLWSHGLYWYPYTLITPGLCILISLMSEAVSRFSPAKFVLRILEIIGQYSFELYLVHILVFACKNHILYTMNLYQDSPLVWPVTFLVTLAGTLLLRRCSTALSKAFRKPAAAGQEVPAK